MKLGCSRWKTAVRMLCALALFAVGFAHKMPVASAAAPLEIAAYMLPDGTLPVLCRPGSDGDTEKGKHHADKDCEACRISASVHLPAPPQVIAIHLPVAVNEVLPIRAEAFYRQLFPPNAAPRAPPADTVTV